MEQTQPVVMSPSPQPGQGMDYSALPEAPPSGGAPADISGESEQGIVPSRWEQFQQSLKQVSGASPVGFSPDDPGAWVRGVVEHFTNNDAEARGEKKLSPADANKQFPGLPVPFNEEIYPSVAELHYQNFQHQQKIQEWKSRGGATPGADFAAGMAGGFLDPVNLALGLATGGASRFAASANALRVARAVAEGTMTAEAAAIATQAPSALKNLRNVFGQNLAINELTGVPSYLQEKREGQDVSFADSQVQAVEGAIGGTAFHYALGGLISATKKGVELVRRTPHETQAAIVREAVAQKEMGQKIVLDDAHELEASRQAGQVREGEAPSTYQFKDIAHPSEKPFYMAKDGANNAKVDFQNYGPGAYAVDDAHVANNSVSSPEGGPPGVVGHLDIPEGAKFLDLEQSATSEETKPIMDALEQKFGDAITEKLEASPDGVSVKDLIDGIHELIDQGKVPETALADIQEIAKKAGFDGYKYVEDHGDFGKKNGVVMFDENVKPSAEFNANRELTPIRAEAPQVPSEQALHANSENGGDQVDQQIREFKHEASLNSTKEYMDPIVAEQVKNAMARLEALAKLDPSLKEEMQALAKEKAIDAKELSLLKELADCVVGGIV